MRAHRLLFALSFIFACKSAPPPPPPEPPPPPPVTPPGPTKTDFETISKKLMARCVSGGWIDEWRSKQPDVTVAKPRVFLAEFEDRTEQGLDQTYLRTTLHKRMKLSGVYEMVAEGEAVDFLAKGKLLKMAEKVGGERISVYTATLSLVDPKTNREAYSCEATVKGEM